MGNCLATQRENHPGFTMELLPWVLHDQISYPLVMTNIAIENGPFIVDLPIKDGDFL